MYRILYALLPLLFFSMTSFGQYDGDKYWPMEEDSKIKQILRSPTMEPVLQDGLFGKAIYLDGKSSELNLGALLQMGEPITVSFWFKPEQYFGEQSLIRQSRISNTADSEVGRFIEVFLNDRFGRIRTEKSTLPGDLPNVDILAKKDNGWLFFTYTGSEFGYQIYIQGQEVSKSNDGTMFQDLGNFNNDLVIGRGKSSFIGRIDDLKIFYERLDDYAIKSLLDTDRKRMKAAPAEKSISSNTTKTEAPTKEAVGTKGVVLMQEGEALPESQAVKESLDSLLKDRKVEVHEEFIIVKKPTIRLKIWDSYKRIDNDRVSIFLNSEDREIERGMTLTKKRKYKEIEVKLADQEENLLIFFADHMGNYYSSASIAVQVEGYEKVFNLSANNEKNAALKIIQKKASKPKQEKLASVTTEQEKVQLQFLKSRNSAADSQYSIRVKVEKTPGFYSVFLEDEAQKLDLNLEPEESRNIIIGKNQNWGAEEEVDPVKLIVSDEKGELKRHSLFLHRKFYEFSITRKGVYEVVDNGQRKISISKDVKEVTLRISDHDIPDEDKITIYYDNKVVVEKQELLAEAIDVVVPLNAGLIKHRLSIDTDSFGTGNVRINTPRIRVLANGKEIDTFVFRLLKEKNNGGAVIDLVVE